MSSAYLGLHPLLVFGSELIITTCALAFTNPKSHARLLGLFLVALCAYHVIVSSAQFMRLHWASLLSGCAVGFVLQYIENVLLRGWSYETIANRISKRSKEENDVFDDEYERLYLGFMKTLSFRNVGTKDEAKNTPCFCDNKPPSKISFLLQQILLTIFCMLVVDYSAAQPPPINRLHIFAHDKVHIFTRLSDISEDEVTIRVISTLVYWINMWAIMQGVTSLCASIAVAMGISQVDAWRPLFGQLAAAYNLRGFWGKFWHQTLRHVLSGPPSFVAHQIFYLQKGSLIARYTTLFLTFMLSGLLHTFAELGGGVPIQQSGTMRFFIMQAVGIIVEDFAQFCFADINERGKMLSLLARTLGYVWVALFLVWTTPGWLYPDASLPAKAPFLPFTVF